MPWHPQLLWRYLVTAGAAAVGVLLAPVGAGQRVVSWWQALPDGAPVMLLQGAWGLLPTPVREVGATLGALLLPQQGPAWLPAGLAAVLAPTAAGLAWRRWSRCPTPPRPEGVLDPQRRCGRDVAARIDVDRRGYLFARQVRFRASGLPERFLPDLPPDYELRFLRPVAVHTARGRTWWAAGNEFYWVDAAYGPETAEAAVEAMRWRRRPRVDAEQVGTGQRREEILASLRMSSPKHHGLVCIRCRTAIDVRDAPVAPLWTEAGVRLADAKLLCTACRSDGGDEPRPRPARIRSRDRSRVL